jgi:hypothetical protein
VRAEIISFALEVIINGNSPSSPMIMRNIPDLWSLQRLKIACILLCRSSSSPNGCSRKKVRIFGSWARLPLL